tara:strand:- start:894 stop:1151 length:258 start_codon:yes stop_codon:yes gene_type:complete
MSKTINLIQTFNWYETTVTGRKRIEYRHVTTHWKKRIWDERKNLTHVKFGRGYTKANETFKILKIDKGPCPIPGWKDTYYRIHFE